jgi:hypothetical protein
MTPMRATPFATPDDGLGTVGHIQCLENGGDVILDRRLSEVQHAAVNRAAAILGLPPLMRRALAGPLLKPSP